MSLPPGVAQGLEQDRLRFPAMLPREILIWKAFLRVHEHEYDRFEYNIRLGSGYQAPPEWPEEQRRNAFLNSQKRVDAVGYQGPNPTIFEIKDRAQLSAIGQLVGYRTLWPSAFPGTPPPKISLITNRTAFDVQEVCSANGITCEIVQADFSLLFRLQRKRKFAPRTFSPG